MHTLIIDNFLSKKECDFLIDFYKKNEKKAFLFRDVYPLSLNKNNSKINFLVEKLEETSKLFNSKIDWFELVKWPVNSKQELHFDLTSGETTLASIVYLNEDFEGGQTYYEDTTTIKPVLGRGLFFNGVFYKHGVKKVEKNTRYVVATWYKNS
jgi:hypothetical protein